MVEKDNVLKEKIFYKGIAKLEDAYIFAYDWLRENEFDVTEKLYSEKIQAGGAKDIEIKWNASVKISDYFRITLEIAWKLLGMKEVEIEIDGQKKESNKFSELSITVKGILEKDWSNKWEPNPIHKFFKELYQKYIIPQRIEEKQDLVREITQKFTDEMKAYFELVGKKRPS